MLVFLAIILGCYSIQPTPLVIKKGSEHLFVKASDLKIENNNLVAWNPRDVSSIVNYYSKDDEIIKANNEGEIYIENTNGDSIKLPFSIQEAVLKSPFYLPEMPNTLIIGSKHSKIYQVVLKNGQYVIEQLQNVILDSKLESSSVIIGKIDYSLAAINYNSGEIL